MSKAWDDWKAFGKRMGWRLQDGPGADHYRVTFAVAMAGVPDVAVIVPVTRVVRESIEAAIDRAVAAEKEACAVVAPGMFGNMAGLIGDRVALKIAAAIRNRGKENDNAD